MKFALLRAVVGREKREWLEAFDYLPIERRDVYFRPEYLQPFADRTGDEACCAVFRSNDAVLLYPFLNSVVESRDGLPGTERLRDIGSPYGYGGPVVNAAGEAQEFLEGAWSTFADWCSMEQVVSEFVRFHPLLDNVRWAPPAMKTFKERVTVPIMLESYPAAVWSSPYYRVHRHMLRKAERTGFTFDITAIRGEFSWFVPLYLQTQDALRAGAGTRFTREYFSSLVDGFGNRAWLGVVRHSGEVAAAVVVLEGPTYLHSHLMGYRRDIPTAGMTNLVYHGIALEGARRGKTVLHMGGGRTSSEADSLFGFKKSLSPERRHFWLGARCHNTVLYDELSRRWESQHGPRPGNYLQFYRLPGKMS
jgi:hypothetical protein